MLLILNLGQQRYCVLMFFSFYMWFLLATSVSTALFHHGIILYVIVLLLYVQAYNLTPMLQIILLVIIIELSLKQRSIFEAVTCFLKQKAAFVG